MADYANGYSRNDAMALYKQRTMANNPGQGFDEANVRPDVLDNFALTLPPQGAQGSTSGAQFTPSYAPSASSGESGGNSLGLPGGSLGAPTPAPAAAASSTKTSALSGFAAGASLGPENMAAPGGGLPAFMGAGLNGRLGARNTPMLRGLREAGVRY